jgi:pyruvate dehydrogenase E2 component (dihydrolipoamide acetyltransferase)
MPTQILMPALSPTMTEGNLAKWLKKEGDMVKAGQVIAEIETDKATMEVEAVDEGKIIKILIPSGSQGIKVNTPIALLIQEGESETALDAAFVLPPKPANAPAVTQVAAAPVATPQKPASAPLPHAATGDRIIASPLAKRIAEQAGIDLHNVCGTGPNGRIVKADLEGAHATAASPVSPGIPRPMSSATPAQGLDAKDYADKLGMAYEALPNSSVRKVIARRLTESKQTVPHFYLSIDCELDALLELRKQLNEVSGTKISVNDFVIRATALAMKKIPASNVSWTDAAILQYKDADVSVAVATPNGLITPIIKKADTKTLAQISVEMKDLAARAREGKLRPEEFQGGGFSVSNLGMYGIKEFAAIINPPQSCILAVGAGDQRAVVKNGQLAVATVMTCTLSVDHRAVDGAVGAEFLAAFKPLIEKPHSLVV